MQRLCFGTFIDVLIQCKKERISKKKLANTIIQTIDSQSKYLDKNDREKKERELNHLYKCDGDFSPAYSNIVQLAPSIEKTTVTERFAKNVLPLIDRDKYTQAVLALCNIIENDSTLSYKSTGENIEKFQNYFNQNIQDLLNEKNYVLPDFLANIFLYTVIDVKNTVGKEWLNHISSEYSKYDDFFKTFVNSLKNDKNTIQVWETTEQMKQNTVNIATENKDNNSKSNDVPATQIPNYTPNSTAASLAIPLECKQCLYCEMWKGNVKDANSYASGVYGRCAFYNKDILSKSKSCEMFVPNYGQITHAITDMPSFPSFFHFNKSNT